MSKKAIYWICQSLGWTVLFFYELWVYTLEFAFGWDMFFLAIANIVLSILLTHAYRLVIRERNWVNLPLYRFVPRVLLSGLVLGLVMALINFPIDLSTLRDTFSSEPYLFLISWLAWTKNMFMWVLSYTAYHYVENVRATEVEKILLKTSVREVEAKVLRSQLNPHFVFNALNSIRALVSENPAKAQQSITQLSNLLRNSLLADRRKTVELREELKTVQDYLALEKVRYEDRLTDDFHIDPQTLFLQIPPMMLQTLVENGIKHGVQKAVKGGFIQIVTFLENEHLHIHIRNTGVLGGKESGGFGLKNTERRLQLLYGDDATLFRIFQESEEVVRAEIVLPTQTEGIFRRENTKTNLP
ncbi:MAG: sensor histidine kinase [Runella slithyformis]|nr:MAG: sensor histidine kinase [Runella slithyformis]TAF92359.1 MAG: sensor histidine kinase [Runella sp.]TAG25131.1 MAG: sensor histidine kinase [Cytophagales bacterium]TAG36982.1 MAG: sensor histidine kinase [Cytophagia bacterium]TAF29570.1 MAG: sensor histidine kinase [Runella slithyformis]